MSVIDRVLPSRDGAIPTDVQEKVRRGRQEMRKGSAERRLAHRFWNNECYWYVNEKGMLSFQDTVTYASGGGKPPHRIRNKYNYTRLVVQGKVSQATQRVPSYRVMPSTTDPGDVFAAQLAQKVALFGYDQWMVRRATVKTVTNALVPGEGFAMPYFDPNVGPFIEMMDPETGEVELVGQGEVKILTLTGNEVYWEPGCDFYESRWHCIERARPIDEVRDIPGYLGGKLSADATTGDVPSDRATDNMVLVTEFLERPSTKFPNGRRVVMANQRVIFPVEDYPCRDSQGRALDEPVLHCLSWIIDPQSDRGVGLVNDLIDLQRTINDCWNKILEWKNRALNPQMKAPVGSLKNKPDDVPGAIRYFVPISGLQPEWEQPPAIPQELMQILEMAIGQLRDLSADTAVQADANVAAATVSAVIEQQQTRWQSFLGDLAEFHSRLMRHCLYLVARHYSEERLVSIQGAYGPDLETSFRGADLHSQVDVRVFPESLQAISQETVEQRATNWAQLGWISPTAAMIAIQNGSTDGLMQGYEDDVARMNLIIQRLKQGEDALFSMPQQWSPSQLDPVTGQPGTHVPGWMPREFDDVDTQIQVLEQWMKGSEFDRLNPGLQEAAYQIHEAMKGIQAQRRAEAQAQMAMQAEQQGLQNAGKDQPITPKAMPSLPAATGAGNNGGS
jgi:hypothetical protein